MERTGWSGRTLLGIVSYSAWLAAVPSELGKGRQLLERLIAVSQRPIWQVVKVLCRGCIRI